MPREEGAEQPVTSQDPTPSSSADVQVEQPVAEPAQAQGGSGPWADDLAEMFSDEGVRSQVDGFLRQRVQPRVTRLEQSVADLEPAKELYTAFEEDPGLTYLEITEELFGPEMAETVREELLQRFAEGEAPAVDEDLPGVERTQQELDPRVARAVERVEEQEEREAYERELRRIKEQDSGLVDDDFHPFVLAAEGDFDKAYAGYKQWRDRVESRYREQFGSSQETEESEAQEQPPAVLGSDVQTPAAPPTEKRYESMDEALDDMIADIKANKAPQVVGSV